jgi:N utilization substance protein B
MLYARDRVKATDKAAKAQLLYARDVGTATDAEAVDISDEEIRRAYWAMDEQAGKPREFAEQLFTGVVGRLDELDRLIQEHAQNWQLGRMAAVDRNVLRLAAYELVSGGRSPVSAIINEALELARKYSTQDSAQFVNGILDSIRKNLPENP